MSAVLEPYFQHVVVDKINKTLSAQFREIQDGLSVLIKLEADYNNLYAEMENLKKCVSESGKDIKELLAKSAEKNVTTKTKAPDKTVEAKPVASAVKPPVTKKTAVKKTATKKKTIKK